VAYGSGLSIFPGTEGVGDYYPGHGEIFPLAGEREIILLPLSSFNDVEKCNRAIGMKIAD
jgi:hypothetical protein